MTTGRINQVHTIGGAHARRAPPSRVRAGGGAPMRARAPPPARPHAGRPRASSAGTQPQPGRVSPRLGGACLRPGRRPSCPCGVAPAGARETSSPPKMGGEERGLLLLPSRFREGRSVGRAGRRAAPGVATGRGTLADGRGGGMHRNRGYQSRL